MKSIGYALIAVSLVTFSGCWDWFDDVAEEVIEGEMGCDNTQLASITEPALPNCSKVAACCKFLKGECGEVTLFTPPQSIIDICNANEQLFLDAIDTYKEISEDYCPEYLKEESCSGSVDDTRANYVNAIDNGVLDNVVEGAPSCKTMLDATVGPLNDVLGDAARFLPAECEDL